MVLLSVCVVDQGCGGEVGLCPHGAFCGKISLGLRRGAFRDGEIGASRDLTGFARVSCSASAQVESPLFSAAAPSSGNIASTTSWEEILPSEGFVLSDDGLVLEHFCIVMLRVVKSKSQVREGIMKHLGAISRLCASIIALAAAAAALPDRAA